MDKAFRGILDVLCKDTACVATVLFAATYTLVWTLAFGPSLEVASSMFGLGVSTAVIEFWREPST